MPREAPYDPHEIFLTKTVDDKNIDMQSRTLSNTNYLEKIQNIIGIPSLKDYLRIVNGKHFPN